MKTSGMYKIKHTFFVLISLLLLIGSTGCATSKGSMFSTFYGDDVNAYGANPLTDRDSFEKIDLAKILNPTGSGLDESETDEALTHNRNVIQIAFDKFYEDLDNQKLRRNRLQERILGASDQRCGVYANHIKKLDARTNFGLGSLTTLTAGLGAILTGGAATARALSGTAAILSGTRAEFNQAYFANQTIQVLVEGFQAKRRGLYLNIQRKQGLEVTQYTAEEAVKDAIIYHSNCSLIAGLQHTALSIRRVDNPGLVDAQRVLLGAKKLQHIMNTEPEDVALLDLSNPLIPSTIGIYQLKDDHESPSVDLPGIVIQNQKSLRKYANGFYQYVKELETNNKAAELAARLEKLRSGVIAPPKEEFYAELATRLEKLRSSVIVAPPKEEFYNVIPPKDSYDATNNILNAISVKAKKMEADILALKTAKIELMDEGERRLITIKLNSKIIESHQQISYAVKRVMTVFKSSINEAQEKLKDDSEVDMTARVKKAQKVVNNLGSELLTLENIAAHIL